MSSKVRDKKAYYKTYLEIAGIATRKSPLMLDLRERTPAKMS